MSAFRAAQRAMLLAVVLAAASSGRAAAEGPVDTLEPFNRTMFGFNAWFVESVIDPVGGGMRRVLPEPVRQLAANVYENLTEPEFVVANWFAGNGFAASQSLRRFIINTTAGLGGVYDVAGMLGIERTHVEFGAAVCQSGLPTGPYLVLPLIGPTNVGVASSTTVFFVGGFYVLSLISPWLATADLVIDISASAASLRYADDTPDRTLTDPYQHQRQAYWQYLNEECLHRRAAVLQSADANRGAESR